MTTPETITDEQIRALRSKAENAGDVAMVEICNLALTRGISQHDARASCARAISDAEAHVVDYADYLKGPFNTNTGK